MDNPIKVLLVEDHAGYREVITRALKSADNLEVINQFGTVEFALRALQNATVAQTPDVILLDLNLPGTSGLDALPWLRQYTPTAKVIILTQSDKEADIVAAISRGASGYLLKSSTASQIKESIKTVHSGGASLDPNVAKFIFNMMKERKPQESIEKPLSARELEVLVLLGEGLVKKEIASQLNISVTTVAYHIKHIYEKLEVQNGPAAVSKGYKTGLL